jgi:hypothetical protein
MYWESGHQESGGKYDKPNPTEQPYCGLDCIDHCFLLFEKTGALSPLFLVETLGRQRKKQARRNNA